MEPPELKTEDSGTAISEIKSVPQESIPMETNAPDESPSPQLIISKTEEMNDYMESLVMENHLPSCNVPEKIIIALDVTKEENNTCFHDNGGKEMQPFTALLNAIQVFLSIKSLHNERHEFGLISLKEGKAFWECQLSSSLDGMKAKLKPELECKAGETIDLTSLFTLIVSKIRTFTFFEDHSVPPPYIVRLLLIYNKSHSIPEIHLMGNIKELLNCPYFFIDVLAAHEPISNTNKCEKIFKLLQDIDTKGYSYFFNVERSMEALLRSILKLLGHPLQRPLQSVADYSF